MKTLIKTLFVMLLGAHILLSRRPTEVNAAVLFHIATLATLLFVLFIASMLSAHRVKLHRYSAWIVAFVFYFYTIGVVTSMENGAPMREVFEFPYRISNLLVALLLPSWIESDDDLRFLIRAIFLTVVIQAARDVVIGGMTFGDEFVTQRLAGREFASLMMLATPGFIAAWTIADREVIRRKKWLYIVLAVAIVLAMIKAVLMYSRTFWFAILPADLFLLLFLLRGKARRGLRRRIFVGVIAIGFAGAAVIAASEGIQSTIAERVSLLRYSASIKQDEFSSVVAESKNSLWVGKGFTYEIEFQKGRYFRRQAHIHNVVLQFLLSAGIVGLCIFMWGIVLLFRSCWALQKHMRDPLSTAILVGVTLTLTNFFLLGMVQSIFRREHTYLMIGICIVLLVPLERRLRALRRPRIGGYGNPGGVRMVHIR